MEKKAITKGKEKETSETKPVSVKQLIKKYVRDDGICYSVKIKDSNTGKLRPGPSIPRIPEIERKCIKENTMWPIQLYCGIRSVELDRDIKSLETVWDCIREVLLNFLNGYTHVGLADVEKILRWGDCNVYLIACPPPISGKVKGVIENGRGEHCEWFYEIVYGVPDLLRATFAKYKCESSRENMERLEKAGHITVNYDKIKADMYRNHPEVMQDKMNKLKEQKLKELKEEVERKKKEHEEEVCKIMEEHAALEASTSPEEKDKVMRR
ncbi:MAG: hypothetical protein ACTSUE_02065 [Promethearchaeota archaeon]